MKELKTQPGDGNRCAICGGEMYPDGARYTLDTEQGSHIVCNAGECVAGAKEYLREHPSPRIPMQANGYDEPKVGRWHLVHVILRDEKPSRNYGSWRPLVQIA